MLERAVKRMVSSYLRQLQMEKEVPCWFDMPVPYGYGKTGLDYYGSIRGLFFAIETKAPGEWLTPRQRDIALAILRSGAKVFIISGDVGLEAFKRWVDSHAA